MSQNIFNFQGLAAEDKTFNIVSGTAEADTLEGTAAADKITGGDGNDTITESSGGDDILAGGAGDDIISISRGADSTIFASVCQGADGIIGEKSRDRQIRAGSRIEASCFQ